MPVEQVVKSIKIACGIGTIGYVFLVLFLSTVHQGKTLKVLGAVGVVIILFTLGRIDYLIRFLRGDQQFFVLWSMPLYLIWLWFVSVLVCSVNPSGEGFRRVTALNVIFIIPLWLIMAHSCRLP